MSKLAIVLCACIFFASTLVECEVTLDGTGLQLRVQTVRKSLGDRIQQVHDEVFALGAQPSAINFAIIEDFKENVTSHMDEVDSLVTLHMAIQKGEYNRSECMRHYNDYEALARSVVTQLDDCVSSVVHSTLESFGKTIAAAGEAVRKMKIIEDEALQCEETCDFINTTVTKNKENVLQSVEEALADYKKLVNGSNVLEVVRTETDYYHFIESEDAFWNDLLTCLTTPLSSTSTAA